MSNVIREALELVEHIGRHNGHDACPLCNAFEPLDPANPREWEQHTPDCKLGQALAETADPAPAEATVDPQAESEAAPADPEPTDNGAASPVSDASAGSETPADATAPVSAGDAAAETAETAPADSTAHTAQA